MSELAIRTIAATMLLALIVISGCQSNQQSSSLLIAPDSVLSKNERWAVLALENESYTSTAADAYSSILETHLRSRGISLIQKGRTNERYTVSGQVNSWHYEGLVSAKPVVDITLSITDTRTMEVVWSRSISKTGSRRETISGLADRAIKELVKLIPLGAGKYFGEPGLEAAQPVHAKGPSLIESVDTAQWSERHGNQYFLGKATRLKQTLSGKSAAFFYGINPPIDVLSQFDRLIVEPDNIKPEELKELSSEGAAVYAYLSVGEVGPYRRYFNNLKPEWVLGENPAWQSRVLDLSLAEVRLFLLQQVNALSAQGYNGLFLDTMDSFNLYAKTPAEIEKQTNGLKVLIKDIARHFPRLRLMTNRGFEVLNDIAPYVDTVVAESLFTGWDNLTQSYVDIEEGDRTWLQDKLYQAQHLGLDVIVIDYVAPEHREAARKVASLIAEQGFIPWVANPGLDYVGVGALEVLPRKVLMLYDSNVDGPIEASKVHKFVAMPVEYMGYVPEYLDMANEALPTGELKGRYAGIVTWPSGEYRHPALREWLQAQLDDQLPVAMMGMPPVQFDETMRASLGIETKASFDAGSAQVNHQDQFIKPERSMSRRIESVGVVSRVLDADHTIHLSYQDKNSERADMVATGDFGGFAWQPGVMEDGLDYETIWVVEPFKFLRQALQLPNAPMPDVTTENGKRLWLAHIDGDALPSWAEMPGKRLGADVIYDEVLEPYGLPHTVSIVEAEMTQFEQYADRRDRMFSTIKKTFALDTVELASHTFSHPFKWSKLAKHRLSGKYNLSVDGYLYNAEREMQGSISFIDKELAPKNKRTEIMLWSGDALPGEDALAVLDRMGIPNMNGGLTLATNANRSMSLVSPMARPVGNYVQVYAPIMNENVYTNDWLGPFDGFKRAIETLEITEHPRRLKPINIYYHFYSGTKISAMTALKQVYDWTIEQDIFPVYGSDFARKVPDHRKAGVARYLDGEWKISRMGNVRSLRVLDHNHWPLVTNSDGLTGARQLHDGIYIHTDGSDDVSFRTTRRAPKGVHLVSSNGQIQHWKKTYDALEFRIKGEVPVVVELGGSRLSACSIHVNGKVIRGTLSKTQTQTQTFTFKFTNKDTGNAILYCPA